MPKRKTTEDFIIQSKLIHGDKYDYSKTVYIKGKLDVIIVCPHHGEFKQRAINHTSGFGCIQCGFTNTGLKLKLAHEEFISKSIVIHNNKYDYSKTIYTGMKDKVYIVCSDHGIFQQEPHNHLNGQGCPKCRYLKISDAITFDVSDFISKSEKCHNGVYDYSQVSYIDRKTKVDIVCRIHGIFTQKPHKHLQGQGCPKCNSSKGERKIMDWLNVNNIEHIKEKRFPNCKHKYTLPFDFYIPSLNMCIEYDGEQHFVPMRFNGEDGEMEHKLSIVQLRDSIKTQYCIDNGINLLRIPYTKFKNINEILKSSI
jgi:very-short-patch-repair endonuclease